MPARSELEVGKRRNRRDRPGGEGARESRRERPGRGAWENWGRGGTQPWQFQLRARERTAERRIRVILSKFSHWRINAGGHTPELKHTGHRFERVLYVISRGLVSAEDGEGVRTGVSVMWNPTVTLWLEAGVGYLGEDHRNVETYVNSRKSQATAVAC